MNNTSPKRTTSLTIDALPAELLAYILTFLDENAPSDLRLHDQPDADMLRVSDPHSQYLKTVSLVNQQWRATVLPLLFRSIVWYFSRLDLMLVEQSKFPSAIPFLPFIRDNGLTPYVKSLTLVITSARPVGDGDIGLYRRGDGSGHYGYSLQPLSPSPHGGERDIIFNQDSNWLWRLLFDVINPVRFTIIAPPRMLASLLARMLYLGDEWVFNNQTHHVLSLSQDQRRTTKPAATHSGTVTGVLLSSPNPASRSSSSASLARPASLQSPCALFTLQPWTSVLLNEGSSTQAYKTYEHFHRRPPSLLGALLGAEAAPNNAALLPPTIRALSYVGIFPLSTHLLTLIEHLPPIERLFVQLVPRNDILKDRSQMKGLDMDDLWAERDSVYEHIMSRLRRQDPQVGNWRYVREFESGDMADEDAQETMSIILRSPEWRLEREGVFLRENKTVN